MVVGGEDFAQVIMTRIPLFTGLNPMSVEES